MNSFETFLEYSVPSTFSKNTIKMIGHHSGLRDVMGQSYLICACTRANHVRYSSVHVTSFEKVLGTEYSRKVSKEFIDRFYFWGITLKILVVYWNLSNLDCEQSLSFPSVFRATNVTRTNERWVVSREPREARARRKGKRKRKRLRWYFWSFRFAAFDTCLIDGSAQFANWYHFAAKSLLWTTRV